MKYRKALPRVWSSLAIWNDTAVSVAPESWRKWLVHWAQVNYNISISTHNYELFGIAKKKSFAVLLFCLLHGDICLGRCTRHV